MEFLRDLGALAVRARGVVCKTNQLVCHRFQGAIFRAEQIFLEPSMTHSCELSRARR